MDELKTNDYLKGIVLNLPESPGIYQYLNAEGTIIYVGKAKNLKRRVSSYFNREHEPGKTRVLVSKIADIRYIVVNTEEDALLLENNLIKKYKPRYNVLLKDDKTYPSICVQNEYFPRVFKTRRIIRNGSSYYGPYSHIPSMYAVLDLIKHLYPLRTCNLNLSPENIRAGKFNVCLEYHIKNCAGPCIGKQNQEEYLKNIAEIKEILKGNTQEIERMLYQQMQELAAEMKFEEAQKIKEKYLLLENYRSKSEVVSNVLHNIDVFSIEEDTDEKSAFINYLHITNGAINQAFTFEYKKRLNETKEELLSLGIIEMRERYKSLSREIIVPFELDMELKDVIFTIPQRGDKKKLLELSILNVKQYKADRLKQAEKLNPEQRTVRLLKEIQQELHLDRLPMRIECFDNSNIQGSDPVAGCVVFIKGKPSKKDYRKYNIKTVEGPDDYASMKEVVKRRYQRTIEENAPLPDLLITDGGQSLQLDGQAVGIKTGHIGSLIALHVLFADDDILDDLVQGGAHVDVAVCIRRAVVQDKLGLAVVVLDQVVVQVVLLPILQHGGLLLGQTGTHLKQSLGQIQGTVVLRFVLSQWLHSPLYLLMDTRLTR